MRDWKFSGSTALVALVAGNSALADVTPEEVWSNWQAMGVHYGQEMTAESAVRSGDALRVTGLNISSQQEGASFDLTIDDVTFRDMGDGRVEIVMSDEYPVSMIVETTDSSTAATPETTPETPAVTKPTEIELTVSHPGLVMIAGGSATETRYDFNAPTIGISLTEIDGVDAEKINAAFDLTLTGMAGNYILTGEVAKALSSSFSAAAIGVVAGFTDPEEGGTFNLTVDVADLAGTSSGTMGTATDMADMPAALAAGFATEGGFTYGAASYDFDFADAADRMASKSSVEGGSFTFAMDKTRMNYGGGVKGASMALSGSTIPFPELVVTYADAAFNLLMPISKSDTPTDFALLTRLVDLSLPGDVWGMFDPAGTLPRDPLTVILDTTGTARLTVDLMDTAQMAALGDAPPGELHALKVNSLQVKATGAELTGSGALTFDNGDLATYAGMPAPTGTIEMKLTGGNALLDNLASMGLIPEDQIMGARMMLGMFAKMVEGQPDTMTSTLEFKDKSFFANGMQLK
ncbi:DUF2125 domain-containing protein [Paracoccaceae bacterium Fryx2]|nr:DUF2125 domain-containing protein [Paracoccaceae bacterium Fryx2]